MQETPVNRFVFSIVSLHQLLFSHTSEECSLAKILSKATIFTDISLKFQLKTLLAIADPYANASVVNAPAPNPGVATILAQFHFFSVYFYF